MKRQQADAGLRAAQAVALAYRDLMVLRCAQAAGGAGMGLAHALCDMMLAGETPGGWPIPEVLGCIDRAGAERCVRTARLRAHLVEIATSVAAGWLADDDCDDGDAAAAA